MGINWSGGRAAVPKCARAWMVFVVLVASLDSVAGTMLSGPTMGTRYRVRIGTPLSSMDLERVERAIRGTLDRIEAQMSNYRPDSALSRFNAARGAAAVAVPAALAEVVAIARGVSAWSGGAFDVTVAPLVEVWRFGPWGPPGVVPAASAVEAARARVDYRALEVRRQPPRVRKLRPDIAIDLSAIAKGYAVDRVSAVLGAHAVRNFLVEIGGEVRVAGTRADGAAWQVGVESPDPGRPGLRVVALRDEAIATSGDYRQWFAVDGVRYSHTIDPHSGRPVRHRLAAVSVISADAARADAMATALMVLGPELGYRRAREAAVAARLVVRRGEDFEELVTASFRARMID